MKRYISFRHLLYTLSLMLLLAAGGSHTAQAHLYPQLPVPDLTKFTDPSSRLLVYPPSPNHYDLDVLTQDANGNLTGTIQVPSFGNLFTQYAFTGKIWSAFLGSTHILITVNTSIIVNGKKLPVQIVYTGGWSWQTDGFVYMSGTYVWQGAITHPAASWSAYFYPPPPIH